MEISFKTWLEDAGYADLVYSNADEPEYDSKIPSKYKTRDVNPERTNKKDFNPDLTFGKRNRIKKKMKEGSTYIIGNGLAHKGDNHG